ncbi:MAG: restriction endonuclease-like protein [Gammaproteobacteria bacterium]|nr:restriction endonuclease-like protein [Gammaproteobacteria bacterium]MBU1441465.1 restriction endonuclease-like protein [Gammaproteobacteria bacterium]MBU2287288.1 restriction endonuclease-like protein [Gammaproteobacteria bacterium]
MTAQSNARLFIDDVEFAFSHDGLCRWRPSFYAGRVSVHAVYNGLGQVCWFDVSPSASKSGDEHFGEMVERIRAFDQALLRGLSSATMAFGRDGQHGLFANDVLLTRIRSHGPAFLEALASLSASPHSALSSERRPMPLVRMKSFHPTTLQDRRLVALIAGIGSAREKLDTIQLYSRESQPTVDTPVNRALLALAKRFRATVAQLRESVEALQLGGPKEDQLPRVERRLAVLVELEDGVSKIIRADPFRRIARAETSATGLAQIAAHPRYSRPYRLGAHAMMTGVEGDEAPDDLHVNHAWGIYETWCYVEVLRALEDVLGIHLAPIKFPAVTAQLAFGALLHDGRSVEALFQAEFPSGARRTAADGLAWSVSRERRPDVVLILSDGAGTSTLIFDAKWRSGRQNVLDAMQSAHIYRDSLRLGATRIAGCMLLLPAETECNWLEAQDFFREHHVGAIADFNVDGGGCETMRHVLRDWSAAPAAR